MVRNFYVPADISDFIDSDLLKELNKANDRLARQDKQEEENIAEHARQVEAADGGVLALKTLNNALKAGTAGIQASKAHKQRKEKKTAKQKQEDKEQFNILFPGKSKDVLNDWFKEAKEYSDGHDDITFKDKLKEIIGREGHQLEAHGIKSDSMEEAFKFIEESSSSRLLNIQEFAAVNYTSTAITEWQEGGESTEGYNGNYQHWLRDQLNARFNLSPTALAGLITPQAERQSQTIAGTRGAVFAANRQATGNLEFTNNLDVAVNNSDTNAVTKVYAAKFTELKSGFEAKGFSSEASAIKSREKIKGLINSTIWRGKYGTHELNALKEGIVQNVPQGSGPNKEAPGYDLLTLDDFKFLEGQVTAYNDHILKADLATGNNLITTAMVGIRDGTINQNTGKPWEQKDLQFALETARNTYGVDTASKLYKQAENYNPGANTSAVLERERAEFESAFLKADKVGRQNILAQVTHPGLRTELLAIDEKVNAYDAAIQFDGDYTDTATQWIEGATKDKVNVRQKGLSRSQELMRDIIDNKYNEIKIDVLRKAEPGTSPEDITDAIEARLNGYLTGKGFNSTGGLYSADNEGQFPGVLIQKEARQELLEGSGPNAIAHELRTGLKEFNGNVKNYVNSGKAITNAEFASLQLNNFNETTGKFEGLSRDIVMKAEVLGVSPLYLIRKKAESLKNPSKDSDKVFVAAYDIEGFVKSLPTDDPYRKLSGFIEHATHNNMLVPGIAYNLLYASERINPQKWSPNQMRRLIQLERDLNPKAYKEYQKKKKDDKIADDKKQKQKEEKEKFSPPPVGDFTINTDTA